MTAVRFLAGVAATATLVGALAGCTGGDEPGPGADPTQTAATPSATEGTDPLEVSVFGDDLRLATYQRIVDAFERQNPDVEVEVTTYPDRESAAAAALTTLEAGWDTDVLLTDYRHFADLVATGGLEPVDARLEERGLQFGDDYHRLALTAFSADNRLQCMPAEVSPYVVYYNERLIRRSQPGEPVELPNTEDSTWTWEEFERLARSIAGRDLLGPVKGAHIPVQVETLTALIRSAGGDVVDNVYDPTALTLTSDEALLAATELLALARDPSVSPTVEELAEQSALKRFTAGELGLLVGTRDDLPALREAEDLQFDVLPLPSLGRTRSVARMNAWCLNASSDQVERAADFVAFAVGREGAEIASRSGAIVPSTLGIVYDDVFAQPDQQPANSFFFDTAIRRAEPMPYARNWDRVVEDLETVLRRVVRKEDLDLAPSLERRLTRLEERAAALLDDGEG